MKAIGVILIAAGLLGLVYRGFTYTSDRHNAKLGPLAFSVKEKKRVNVPVWVGVTGVVVGTGLILFDRRRK